MKNITRLSLVLMGIFCTCFRTNAQAQNGYTITGHIAGLENGERVLMSMVTGQFSVDDRDSAFVKDGQFIIKGVVPEGPRDYLLQLGKKAFKKISIAVDNNESITINCDKNYLEIPHGYLEHWVKIEGAETNDAVSRLAPAYHYWRQIDGALNASIRGIVDSVGIDRDALSRLYALKQKSLGLFYQLFFKNVENDQAKAIPMLADYMFDSSGRASFWTEVYNKLDDDSKASFAGKSLKNKIVLSVGQQFPSFNLPGPDGKNVALKDFLGKGKVTLVQFYASNSVNVDDFQKELQFIYKKYHDKGLNMVGISSDVSAKKWKIAAADLPWPQVSDLKGANGIVGTVYKEYGAPGTLQPNTTNVLIDHDGKILAWDVNGPELQWYLWMQFGS